MKKGYHDYIPIVKNEKKNSRNDKEVVCPFTGIKHPLGTKFVKDDLYKLQFGNEFPKVSAVRGLKYVKTIRYPKTDGSNGKVSRFR